MAADPDTDDRTMKAGGDVTIRDRFLYENLIPGDEYVISGRVMLKPAGSLTGTKWESGSSPLRKRMEARTSTL